MEKNEILKIYGTDYKEMTKELLAAADLAARIPGKDVLVGIKPNLVTPSPAEFGGTTHPEVVSGIIEYLQERDFRNLLVAEGSWVGDRTAEAYEYCGYRGVSETYGVPFFDTQKDRSHKVDCAGMKLSLCDVTDRIGFLINVPVLKGHCQTKMTCALKNLKGLIPNAEKRHFHTMGLHRPIAHLQAGIRQDFVVVDHICGDPYFEEGGSPLTRNCVMAAADPVLVDAYACWLLGLRTEEVPYVGMAERLGIGSADLEKAKIRDVRTGMADGELPKGRSLLDVSYAVEECESCSACYAALTGALRRLEEEGLLSKLTDRVGIGQGMQGKTGRLGVGRCTKDFDVNIPGCPPDEESVYQGLREYILQAGRNKV